MSCLISREDMQFLREYLEQIAEEQWFKEARLIKDLERTIKRNLLKKYQVDLCFSEFRTFGQLRVGLSCKVDTYLQGQKTIEIFDVANMRCSFLRADPVIQEDWNKCKILFATFFIDYFNREFNDFVADNNLQVTPYKDKIIVLKSKLSLRENI